MSEFEAINGLLEIEKKAEEVTEKAKLEAEKNIVDARKKAETEYKLRCESTISQLEEGCNLRIKKVTSDFTSEMDQFKTKVNSLALDSSAFEDLLTKVLFEKK